MFLICCVHVHVHEADGQAICSYTDIQMYMYCTCSTCLEVFPELVLIGHAMAGSPFSFCGIVHVWEPLSNDYNYGLCSCT